MTFFFILFHEPRIHHREIFRRCIQESAFYITRRNGFDASIAKFSCKPNKVNNILFLRRENKCHYRVISSCCPPFIHFIIHIIHFTIIFFRFLYEHIVKICHTPYNAHVKSYVYLISHLHFLKKIKDTKKLTLYKLVGRKYYNNILIIIVSLNKN